MRLVSSAPRVSFPRLPPAALRNRWPGPARTSARVSWTASFPNLPRTPLHVQRHRDEQVRTGLHWFGGGVSRGGGVGCHDPHVADVVAVARSLRIWAFDIRREQSALRHLTHELDVIVTKCRRVFLEAPADVDRSQIQIVRRIGFAIYSVAHATCFELLWTSRKVNAAEPRHPCDRNHFDVVDFRVDDECGRNRRAAE